MTLGGVEQRISDDERSDWLPGGDRFTMLLNVKATFTDELKCSPLIKTMLSPTRGPLDGEIPMTNSSARYSKECLVD